MGRIAVKEQSSEELQQGHKDPWNYPPGRGPASYLIDIVQSEPCEHCDDLEEKFQNLEDLLHKVQHQRNKLYIALCDLYDVQNGPPLIQESLKYEKAMKQAQKIIKYIKEGK
jgi:hypothetical protein